MNRSVVLAVLVGLVMAAPLASAQGNPEAGKQKAATCAACHGPDGNSPNPQYPKIAGQHADYLATQLEAYKSGARQSPIMQPLAAQLSEQDMLDLAAYFSSQDVRPGAVQEDLLALGQQIYRAGNKETGVPACMACHGPAGTGNAAAGFPALAGQNAQYTAQQLELFRSGERTTDNAGMMRSSVARMTDEEIQAVASYVEGLH